MSKDAKYKSSEETTTNVTGQFSVYVKDHFTISDKRNKEKLHQITVTDFRASPPRGSIYLGLVCSSLVTVSFFLFPGSSNGNQGVKLREAKMLRNITNPDEGSGDGQQGGFRTHMGMAWRPTGYRGDRRSAMTTRWTAVPWYYQRSNLPSGEEGARDGGRCGLEDNQGG